MKSNVKDLWWAKLLTSPVFWICLAILAALLFFGKTIRTIIDKLMVFFGLKKGPDTQAVEDTISSVDGNSPWNRNYYKTHPGRMMTGTAATVVAKDVYDAFGYFNDDEEQAIGAIKSCQTKQDLSLVCDKFYEHYKADMLVWLRGGWSWPQDRLSDSDLKVITDFSKTLKDG